jgi:hypothetical protein
MVGGGYGRPRVGDAGPRRRCQDDLNPANISWTRLCSIR